MLCVVNARIQQEDKQRAAAVELTLKKNDLEIFSIRVGILRIFCSQ